MPMPKDLPPSLQQHGHCQSLCLLHQNLSSSLQDTPTPSPKPRSACTKPNASATAHRSDAARSAPWPTWRTSPQPGSTGTTPGGSCTASAAFHRPKPKPPTTLQPTPPPRRHHTQTKGGTKPGVAQLSARRVAGASLLLFDRSRDVGAVVVG